MKDIFENKQDNVYSPKKSIYNIKVESGKNM